MNSRHPDLQRLLATLNESSTAPNDGQPWQQIHDTLHSTLSSNVLSDSHYASNPDHGSVSLHEIQHNGIPLRGGSSQSASAATSNHHLKASKQEGFRSRSTTPALQAIPDASRITTWPAAVKHVSRYIVNDDKITLQIKHLISQQHKHEQDWWAQREVMVARHSGRADNQDKAAELLKSMGALTVPIMRVGDAANEKELEAFDKKVHKALCDMVKDYESQLRKMAIPFFAIKNELIINENEMDVDGGAKGKLDNGELRQLQQRIVAHLEDLLVDG